MAGRTAPAGQSAGVTANAIRPVALGLPRGSWRLAASVPGAAGRSTPGHPRPGPA